MNAIFSRPQSNCCVLKTAFFHSTTVLERKRSSTCKSLAQKKKRSKEFLKEHHEKIRRALEQLKREKEEAAAKKAKEEKEAKEAKENRNKQRIPNYWQTRQINYCDKEFDYIFQCLFGHSRRYDYYSIDEDEEHRWWHQFTRSSYHSRNSWRWKYRFYNQKEEEKYDDSYTSTKSSKSWRWKHPFDEEEEEDDNRHTSSKCRDSKPDSTETCHRQTLGLSPWVPLKLEDVKHAYRTCALKWHPDRHDNSRKAEAEAKFKLCTVAYRSLIEKLQSPKIS